MLTTVTELKLNYIKPNNMTKKETTVISCRIAKNEAEQLKCVAEKTNTTISNIIMLLIKRMLNQLK